MKNKNKNNNNNNNSNNNNNNNVNNNVNNNDNNNNNNIINILNWTSGNVDIDNLIRECQLETLEPDAVIEWIPYDNLQNIKYLTEGGCSKIYTAVWINGCYREWDSKRQQLKRFGSHKVILKRLENVENANKSWLDEVCNQTI